MSHIEWVIATHNEFEDFLRHTLGATGEDSLSLIDNLRTKLPGRLIGDLHYIRQKRNPMAHGKKLLDSPEEFHRVSVRVRESLLRAANPEGAIVSFLIINKYNNKPLEVSPQISDHSVYQFDRHKNINQQWQFRDAGDGFVIIMSAYSGKCLDVDGYREDEGAVVHQWKHTGALNQHWRLTELDDGSYNICARHSGHVLDATWEKENGVKPIQWSWHGKDIQRWWLKPAI